MVKKKIARKYFKDDPFLTSLGNKVRELRISKGISIEKLADKSEMAYSQLSRIELGKVNFGVSLLPKIAKALKVELKEFIT